MRSRSTWAAGSLLALWSVGCAYLPLSKGSLDGTRVVAIVSRLSEDPGPRSTVFRDDSTYSPQLESRKLDSSEADRRLAAVLGKGSFQKEADGTRRLEARTVNRFELADSLRAELLSKLPKRAPWTKTLSPVEVSRALDSLLVHEVPPKPPDYSLLRQLGADTVIELVVEEYGMRSDGGRAGAYLLGYARMFRIGGGELYHRSFRADDLSSEMEPLDPFAVAKDATLFGERLKGLAVGVTELVAADLSASGG